MSSKIQTRFYFDSEKKLLKSHTCFFAPWEVPDVTGDVPPNRNISWCYDVAQQISEVLDGKVEVIKNEQSTEIRFEIFAEEHKVGREDATSASVILYEQVDDAPNATDLFLLAF